MGSPERKAEMHGRGYILQYNLGDERGMVHLGGAEHGSVLPFALSDCDKIVGEKLKSGDPPGGSGIRVDFDIALKDGGLCATDVCLASRKAMASSKKTSRKSPRKARARRRR